MHPVLFTDIVFKLLLGNLTFGSKCGKFVLKRLNLINESVLLVPIFDEIIIQDKK